MEELSTRHKEFINEYLKCFNATDAYLRIYPKAKYDTARANSSRLLADANIQAEIERRLAERRMSSDEALDRLTDHARGDMGDFLDVNGLGFSLNLQEAKAKGLTRLIKKIKQKTTTFSGASEGDDREVHELEIELYDAQAAVDKILKVNGKYIERKEISGKNGDPIETVTLTPDQWKKTRAERLKEAARLLADE